MATYHIQITGKAVRTGMNPTKLEDSFIAMHNSLDATAAPNDIKVIMHRIGADGYWMQTGIRDRTKYRYMRVSIVTVEGSRAASLKQELMTRAMECCVEYQGKHAEETEMEVEYREIERGNLLRRAPS
jgi:hypothetical protein